MGRGDLTNAEWVRLEPHLPALGRRGGRWNDHRKVINGILFRVRTGIPWRDLPERFGNWKTVYERHRRWSADGRWDRILRAVQTDTDLAGRIDWSMVGVDSTSCRAHQHAAGARKKKTRIPKKGPRPGTTAPTKDSDGPGADLPARSTSRAKAAAARWPSSSPPASGATHHR